MKILMERSEEIFDIVFGASKAEETEVSFSWTLESLTRFANNEIHQNMASENIEVSVRCAFGKKTARAATNKIDRESLVHMTELADKLAALSHENPHLLPMPGPQSYVPVHRAFQSTSHLKAESRSRAVKVPIQIAQSKGLVSAGFFSNQLQRSALGNTRGLRAYGEETYSVFSTTMMADSGSGWAKFGHPDVSKIPIETLALQASEKAAMSRDPVEIAPGNFTVILEPSAVLDLLEFILMDFGGLAVLEKRSALTEKFGKKVFGENITLHDDVHHPQQSGVPYDGEGMPRQSLILVKNGVLKSLAYSRSSAARAGTEPTGHGFSLPNAWGEAPLNIVMAGGAKSLREMIEGTDHGLLVTRFWYIREVDPMEKILTGMTRDGTFLIENGRLKCAVRNMRFNESLFHLLNHVVEMGPSVRASGEEGIDMVVPPVKAKDFHFTATTQY